MTVIIITVFGGVCLLLYCSLFFWYSASIYLKKKDAGNLPDSLQIPISLIIPFRDESENLPGLIEDLTNQNYPRHSFEVIFIDDHSSDNSPEQVREFSSIQDNVRLIQLGDKESGKKEAIDRGIQNASYDWIIQTDADCRIPGQFISLHASASAKAGTCFIAGPVEIAEPIGFWEKMEALEFLSLAGTTMAGFLRIKPVMCNAANISYSRSLYLDNREKLGKHGSASGDDLFLLLEANRSNLETTYIYNKDCIVKTKSAGSIKSFIDQRIRWGSKAKLYRDAALVYLTLIVWMMNLLMMGFMIGSVFFQELHHVTVIFWLVKFVADMVFLNAVTRFFEQRRLMRIFPVAELLYPFYLSITGLLSVFSSYSWKGRKY